MDKELEAYFGRVESSFCGRRGAPLLLSTLDFEKALEWYAAGVPADIVEEGVARYFGRLDARKTPRRRAICLSFAEDHILKVLGERRAAAVGRATGAGGEADSADAVHRFLDSRIAALGAFLARGQEDGYSVLRKAVARAKERLEELLPLSGESFSTLERELKPLDEEVVRLALLESPDDKVAAWRREAAARIAPASGGMDASVFRSQVDLLARREAVKSLGIPRLSLIFWEGGE